MSPEIRFSQSRQLRLERKHDPMMIRHTEREILAKSAPVRFSETQGFERWGEGEAPEADAIREVLVSEEWTRGRMRKWSFIQNETQVAEIRPVDGDCPAKLESGAHCSNIDSDRSETKNAARRRGLLKEYRRGMTSTGKPPGRRLGGWVEKAERVISRRCQQGLAHVATIASLAVLELAIERQDERAEAEAAAERGSDGKEVCARVREEGRRVDGRCGGNESVDPIEQEREDGMGVGQRVEKAANDGLR
ncbi:hypothetical protein B0H14DRAFT_3788628 [Mycena olivaceomarginata]|nr:hypothetical protein B0H14DRAFT_3788628 [Mycena olivaceomarginata]